MTRIPGHTGTKVVNNWLTGSREWPTYAVPRRKYKQATGALSLQVAKSWWTITAYVIIMREEGGKEWQQARYWEYNRYYEDQGQEITTCLNEEKLQWGVSGQENIKTQNLRNIDMLEDKFQFSTKMLRKPETLKTRNKKHNYKLWCLVLSFHQEVKSSVQCPDSWYNQ